MGIESHAKKLKIKNIEGEWNSTVAICDPICENPT